MTDQILQALERDGYCYVQDLLGKAELSVINRFIDLRKEGFQAAKVGPKDNRQRVESIRGDYTYWLDPLNPIDPFLRIFKFLNDLKNSINSKFYLGLQEYECHLAFYPPGTFYQKHLDRFESNSSRSLSFIFYLNENWNESNGGELVLYDKKGNVLKKVWPMPGSFICFLSDEFPHEVKSADSERRSFTGWMHTKIIY